MKGFPHDSCFRVLFNIKVRCFLLVDFLESRFFLISELFFDFIHICFVEIDNIYLRFCLCTFESDTVKSDCPVQSSGKL